MSDYIKREEAISVIDSIPFGRGAYNDYVVIEIMDIPAADVRENVRGEWEDNVFEGMPSHCSVCGYPVDRFYKTKFCPNCGADMRGGKR